MVSVENSANAVLQLRAGNVLIESCPSRPILHHMTSRWGTLVLVVLLEGRQRYSALRRKIGGISERMLAQTLQDLEADGVVRRIPYPVVPPHVEYELTDAGREGAALLRELVTWIQGNLGRLATPETSDIAQRG